MTKLRSVIGDKKICDLVIPGSHDTGSYSITDDHVLVDKEPVFELAWPELLTNWSRTHEPQATFGRQLQAGLRHFDARVVYLPDNGTLNWWHRVSGGEIQEGLRQVRDFAKKHPGEVILFHFNKLASPGLETGISPMPQHAMNQLGTIIIQYLGAHLVDRNRVPSDTPTINQILATKKNVIVIFDNSYMYNKSPLFWQSSYTNLWTTSSNPEDLFSDRSERLRNNRGVSNKMVTLSAAITPSAYTIVGAINKLIGADENIRWILETFFPDLNVRCYDISFEGLYLDLVTVARNANTRGMFARDTKRYSNGRSVNYLGINDMIEYWLRRPNLYKLNILYIDDDVSSSLVDIAIRANGGYYKPSVSITHQGNPRSGFLQWDGFRSKGGRDGLQCSEGEVSYRVVQTGRSTQWKDFPSDGILSFEQQQYPKVAKLDVRVSSSGSNEWHPLYNGNIDAMIKSNLDLYLRTRSSSSVKGFAYVSSTYNHFGDNCDSIPSGTINSVQW